MKKNKKIKTAAVAFVIIVMLALLLLMILKSKSFRIAQLEKQLKAKYGVDFTIENKYMDYEKPNIFLAFSSEGIFTEGECDWKGKLLKDSYAHYYYAEDMNNRVYDLINNDLNDCYIVRDCVEFGANVTIIDMLDMTQSNNFENYEAAQKADDTYFRVYVSDEVKDDEIQSALNSLEQSGFMGNVYFMKVPEELFCELKNSGMTCFYAKSSVKERLSGVIEYLNSDEVEELIFDPHIYMVAEYVPKWDTIQFVTEECQLPTT